MVNVTHTTSALKVLETDHAAAEDLFTQFEQLGPRAKKGREALVAKMIEALSVHTSIEETIFYPSVRQAVDENEPMVLESLEEHHLVKVLLRELEGMPATAERFDAKVTVLMELVRHHVKEEEQDLFPKARKALTRTQLEELGEQLLEAKRTAPTRPHPSSPDTPPANLLAAAVTRPLDAALDAARTAGEAAFRKVRSMSGR